MVDKVLTLTSTRAPADENVTHVVYPTPPTEGDEPDYLRLLHVRSDGFGLVHWWYLPDSYDEWMHVSQISTTDVQPDPTIDRPWKVHGRYGKDGGKLGPS